MATRSWIAYEEVDGVITSAYCHWDGYLEGVGYSLLKRYSSIDDAKTLVDGGDMSTLGDYYSKRKEEGVNTDPKIHYDREILLEEFNKTWCDYLYLMNKEGQWEVYEKHGKKLFRQLIDAINRIDEDEDEENLSEH